MQHRKRLKLAVVESELTHWRLALRCNEGLPEGQHLSEHDITRIITGRKTPSREQAEALAAVLGCEVADLFPELAKGGAQ